MLERVDLGRVSEHNRVHLPGEVVEHHHRIGDHQQNVRHPQRIRVRAFAQAFFHVAHAVVAEVTHQAAVEAWQPSNGRHVVARLERLDERQRVFDIVAFDLDAIMANAHMMVMYPQHRAARQADDRVTAPLLAALDRLEQVGVGLVGQFQVDRQRGVEVGQGFTGQGDTVIAGSGQTQEFFAGHDMPRGLRI